MGAEAGLFGVYEHPANFIKQPYQYYEIGQSLQPGLVASPVTVTHLAGSNSSLKFRLRALAVVYCDLIDKREGIRHSFCEPHCTVDGFQKGGKVASTRPGRRRRFHAVTKSEVIMASNVEDQFRVSSCVPWTPLQSSAFSLNVRLSRAAIHFKQPSQLKLVRKSFMVYSKSLTLLLKTPAKLTVDSRSSDDRVHLTQHPQGPVVKNRTIRCHGEPR